MCQYCEGMKEFGEDRHTNTPEDAADYERMRAADYYNPDMPTKGEAEADRE